MVDISEGIQFRRDGIDPSQWPKLSCSAANQLAVEVSHLILDGDRSLSFRGNGQLSVTGGLRILTGNPATEKLTILADGNVGIGESNPAVKLAVNGTLKLQQGIAVNQFSNDGNLTNNSDLTIPTEKAIKSYVDAKVTSLDTALSMKAAVNGTTDQDFRTKNLTVAGNLDITGTATFRNPVDFGTIKGKGILAGIWAAQPLTDVRISTSGWTWQNVPDTTVNFSLDRTSIVFCTYSINVQPDGDSRGEWLSTRLILDDTAHQSSGSHNQPYVAGDSNVNLNGNLVVPLPAGNHSVSLQWMKPYNNVPTWSNCPSSWGDGFIGGRTLVVMAFYQ